MEFHISLSLWDFPSSLPITLLRVIGVLSHHATWDRSVWGKEKLHLRFAFTMVCHVFFKRNLCLLNIYTCVGYKWKGKIMFYMNEFIIRVMSNKNWNLLYISVIISYITGLVHILVYAQLISIGKYLIMEKMTHRIFLAKCHLNTNMCYKCCKMLFVWFC